MRLERASRLAAEADSRYKFSLRYSKAQQESYYSDIRRKMASTMIESDHDSRIRHSSAKRTTAPSYYAGAGTELKSTSSAAYRCDCNSVRRTRSPMQDLAYCRRPPSPIRRCHCSTCWYYCYTLHRYCSRYCTCCEHYRRPLLYQSASQIVLTNPDQSHNYRPGGSPLRQQSASPARSQSYRSADRIARLQEIERAEYRYRYRLAQADGSRSRPLRRSHSRDSSPLAYERIN